MSDRHCRHCGAEIRWCRDEREQWVPIDLVKVPPAEPGAAYVVVGVEDARYVLKANRARFESLYRKHTCEQGRNARALAKRQTADSHEASAARRQIAFENATLPANVELFRNHRRRR